MHNKIDVCLAPFPNSGGTTILCALWMGVPTLILSNSRYLTNGGANIMKVVGCPEFVVTNKEEYLKRAYEISNNLNFLNGVKRN